MSYGKAKKFGPNGCQVPMGNGTCGETKTLNILNEFKTLYEKRMEQLDNETRAGGDCSQAKIHLQEQWIKDLMEQNEMMARAVEQLEIEATERVQMLEEKLQSSARCICEVMKRYREYSSSLDLDEPFQKMYYVENDLKNLLEFIRRIREDKCWSIEGLQFYDITYKDLFGDCKPCTKLDCPPLNTERFTDGNRNEKKEEELQDREKKITDLKKKTDQMDKYGEPEKLFHQLRKKDEDYRDLKQCMVDMRKALTEEVASKHDIICALKRDILQLEEQCLQADKQTAFKEDIIKELRKEIKQLKQQACEESKNVISKLRSQNDRSRNQLSILQNEVNKVKHELKTSLERSKLLLHSSLESLDVTDIPLELLFNQISSIRNSNNKDIPLNMSQKKLDSMVEHLEKLNISLSLINKLISAQETIDKDSMLIFIMEAEIKQLKEHIVIKDKQLLEQTAVITSLVTKLYELSKGLDFLEANAADFKKTALEEDNQSTKSSLESYKTENESLKGKIEVERKEIALLERQFKAFLAEKEEIKKKLKDAKANTDTVTENLAKNEVVCKKYSKELTRLKEEVEKLQSELDLTKKDKKDLQSQINDLEHEQSRLKKEKKRLSEQQEEHELQVSRLEKERNKAIRDSEERLRQINTLTDRKFELERKVMELENNLVDAKKAKRECEENLINDRAKYKLEISELNAQLLNPNRKPQFKAKSASDSKIVCLCKVLPNQALEISQKCQLHGNILKDSGPEPLRTSSPVKLHGNIRTSSPINFNEGGPLRTSSPIQFPEFTTPVTPDAPKVTIKSTPDVRIYCPRTERILKDSAEDEPLSVFDRAFRGEDGFPGLDSDSDETIPKNNNIIRVQNDTSGILQSESLKNKSVQSEKQKEQKAAQVDNLSGKICCLETKLVECQGRADNLQTAVDFYINSINVLEAAEEKAKMEIEQQKLTITNLQEALVSVKHELDELRQSSKQEVEMQQYLLDVLYVNLLDKEENEIALKKQISDYLSAFDHLMNANWATELEYIESLQDISMMKNNLTKYHAIIKNLEDDKSDLKKELRKLKIQKKSYEEVIQYFQYEVRVMSDQLQNLQEILNMSNETSQVETAQLTEAIENLKQTNEELCGRLCGTEQRFLLENQMNQINESRLEELQEIVSQKEMEIHHYECAVEDMKGSLEKTLKHNQQLESDICCLNCKIIELENTVKAYEQDQLQHMQNNEACQSQINYCEQNLCELKQLLDAKNEALEELKTEYNTQFNILLGTQNELMHLKEGQEERHHAVGHLNDIICQCKNENEQLCADVANLKQKLEDLSKNDTGKDKAIEEYQKVIQELKQSLIELNKNLAETELTNKCLCQEKNRLDEISKQTNQSLGTCQCEIASYAQITEDLKHLVSGLKKQLTEKDIQIKNMENQFNQCKTKLADFCKKEGRREKDCQELIQKLAKSNTEEKRMKDEIKKLERELANMKEDIKKKDEQLNTFRENIQQISSGKKLQDSCLQEENNALKNEINTLRQKQIKMKQENDELQCAICRAHRKISELDEKNLLMKEQLEQYLLELDGLQCEKELIEQKNEQLSNEIQALQNSFACIKRQNRYNIAKMKNLEQELIDVKDHHDNISKESQHVLDNVKLWLEEQKIMNEKASQKMRNYADIIKKLKHEKVMLTQQLQSQQHQQQQHQQQQQMNVQSCMKKAASSRSPPPSSNSQRCPAVCKYPLRTESSERSGSPWSLGSQGTASYEDPRESQCDSPCEPCYSFQDWYSPTFRDREESEEDEENWVAKVEHLTAQFRKANKAWKSKIRNAEYCVSKDDK